MLIASSSYGQLTLEGGIASLPRLSLNKQTRSTNQYAKIGWQKDNWNFGGIGYLRTNVDGAKRNYSYGVFGNYTIEPFKKVPIIFVPEIQLLRTDKIYNLGFLQSQTLMTANLSLGVGYKFNEKLSVLSTINVGYGISKTNPKSIYQSKYVYDYPAWLSLGVKYIFKGKD